MTVIKAVVQDGRVNVATPADWPEGCEVIIEPMTIPAEKIGLDETEWRDDPAALADWHAWIRTVEPLEFTPEELAKIARFDEVMRQFNIEAVRRQMEQGPLP